MSQAEPREKLNALTSLRFFAAAAIVWLHFQGLFGIPRVNGVILGQGVSYFFVLSGFVLTYVYPSLPNWTARRNFLVARFARLWPAHIAALILAVFLTRAGWTFLERPGWTSHLNLVANIFMLQTWTPVEGGGLFSVNGPSWSISTEFAFYFAFLLLVGNFECTWRRKLLLSALVLAALILIGFALNIRWTSPSFPAITDESLLYMFPLARLFEFTAGMSLALFYRRKRLLERLDFISTTAIEIAAIGLIIVYSLLAFNIGERWSNPLTQYLGISAVVPACLAIYVFSQQRGLVSWILGLPLFVVLGEISYSIYLFHDPIKDYFVRNNAAAAWDPAALITCLAIIVGLSYLNWLYLETPARKAIKRLLTRAGSRTETLVSPTYTVVAMVKAAELGLDKAGLNQETIAETPEGRARPTTPAQM
jgi:peptidoglycan/LPS O-acetylase OafA/YrhL